MPMPPKAFLTDARRIADTAELLADSSSEDPETVPAMRELANHMRDFIVRWQSQAQETAHGDLLAKFRTQLAGVERHLERLHLISLGELLETRRNHLLGELLLKMTVELNKFIRDAPDGNRAELEKKFREFQGPDFDPAADFQEITEDTDQSEADWNRLVRDYRISWPDRLEDPIYLGALSSRNEVLDALAKQLEARRTRYENSGK